MLHLGHSSLIDFLSWTVVFTLGSKIVATLIVMLVDRSARDRPGWGSILWWVTKLTPIVAVPCAIWIAVLEGDSDLVRLFCALGLFVAIAVPLAVRARCLRIIGCRQRQASS